MGAEFTAAAGGGVVTIVMARSGFTAAEGAKIFRVFSSKTSKDHSQILNPPLTLNPPPLAWGSKSGKGGLRVGSPLMSRYIHPADSRVVESTSNQLVSRQEKWARVRNDLTDEPRYRI